MESKHKKHQDLLEASRTAFQDIDTSEFTTDDDAVLTAFPPDLIPLKPPRTFLEQLFILTKRSFHQGKVIWLNKVSLVINFLLALYMGLCWFQIPHESQYIYDHSSATYVIIAFCGVQHVYNIAMMQCK